MRLPEEFMKQMKEELGEEFPAFLACCEEPAWRGLRFNGMKTGDWEREALGRPVSWCAKGRCLDPAEAEALAPGKHPLYFAGAYYIQEPSAMLPAQLVDVRPGDRVLDLCAAPGGKSTQLIDAMEDRGLLVSNDVSASRGLAIVKNLERFGVRNFLVTAEKPNRLAASFPAYFDRILVDAPCSGEGMFRREPAMCREWEEKGPDFYRPLQREILSEAVKMLRPGGRLVYSTCTFNRREDEENAAWLEENTPGLRLVSEQKLWPHRCRGEGQYAAVFEAEAGGLAGCEPSGFETESRKQPLRFSLEGKGSAADFFALTTGCLWRPERWYEREGRLYELPLEIRPLGKLRFLRTGLFLGEEKKGRFVPSQALAMALSKERFANTVDFSPEDTRVVRYLKGETIEAGGAERQGGDGWCLALCGGLPLGWARRTGDTLKNKYAPGWRLQ